MPRPGMRATSIYLLLAVALGALAVTGWTVLTAPTTPRTGGMATARVLTTAPCAGNARDSISVTTPTGPVTTTLDGCGRAVGTVLAVEVDADGSVPSPAAMVGTRAERTRSPLPLVILGVGTVLVLGLGFAALRAPAAHAGQQG